MAWSIQQRLNETTSLSNRGLGNPAINFFNIYLFIYLVAPSLSCGTQAP